MIETAILLFAAHFLADYPLQGEWLARVKNHRLEPVPGQTVWPLALAGHAAIHAALVLLILHSTALAMVEFTVHAVTDWLKCDGRLSYNQDQAIHLMCKTVLLVAWSLM